MFLFRVWSYFREKLKNWILFFVVVQISHQRAEEEDVPIIFSSLFKHTHTHTHTHTYTHTPLSLSLPLYVMIVSRSFYYFLSVSLPHKCTHSFLDMCDRLWDIKRERERERESERERERDNVCVCVCLRERKSERVCVRRKEREIGSNVSVFSEIF